MYKRRIVFNIYSSSKGDQQLHPFLIRSITYTAFQVYIVNKHIILTYKLNNKLTYKLSSLNVR